jgi:cell pole-organizing protein PopZ
MGLVFSLACLLTSSVWADVYKYVDEKGQVKYTDKPELLPAELLARMKSQRTDNAAVAERVAAEQQQTQEKNAEQASAADKQKAQKNTAADKAERCTKARERYDQIMSAQRVYSTNEKGERVYMDDKEVEKSRASAKQMMDTWCN